MSKFIIYVVVLAFFSAPLAVGAVSKCYFCSEQGENSECANANKTGMQPKDCNAAYFLTSQSQSPLSSFLLDPKVKATTANFVCVKIKSTSMTDSKIVFTDRACFPEEYLSQEACTYLEHYGAVKGLEMDTCKTCDEDLCNSSVGLQFTFLLFIFTILIKFI